MISQASLTQAARAQQTTELNVAREYCQHLFLSAFYRQAGSERVMFKGGTALRIVFGSPRFSEDLDFSGFGITVDSIENGVLAATGEIEQHGIGVQLKESKPTSGGYLATLDCHLYDYAVRILIEISLRAQRKGTSKKSAVSGQGMLITPDFLPAYTLTLLAESLLVEEKLNSLARGEASLESWGRVLVGIRYMPRSSGKRIFSSGDQERTDRLPLPMPNKRRRRRR